MSLDDNFKSEDKAVTKMTDKCKKELIKAYAESLKSIRSSLSLIYEKYSKDGTLAYADMAKYNRLASLEKEIRAELIKMTGKNAGKIKTLSADVFKEAYYRSVYAIETETQVKLSCLINNKVIEASVQNPISGLSLDDRLEKNRNNIIINVKQHITQGLVQGESYPKMAKRIKDVLEGDATKAIRVVKTEAHRVQQEGRLASMEHATQKGVKMVKVWVATLDEAVRSTHARLDGEKVGIYEEFVIGGISARAPGLFGVPAEDINCRCTVRAEIVGYEPTVRRSKEEGIVKHQSYDEWMIDRF